VVIRGGRETVEPGEGSASDVDGKKKLFAEIMLYGTLSNERMI